MRGLIVALLAVFWIPGKSQNIIVTPQELNFGTVYDTTFSTLQVNVQNNSNKTINIKRVRFYDIYGEKPFATDDSLFSIPAGQSYPMGITFKPSQNIYHNSEMVIESDCHCGAFSVDLRGQGRFSDSYYSPTENLAEEALKSAIKNITGTGYVSLGYNLARDTMFMYVDNKKTNGQGATVNTLECIYTGRVISGYANRTEAQNNPYDFNTEHTFPQSLFSSLEPMRSDLHHLFPTDITANSKRANYPFGFVTSPIWQEGGSKLGSNIFEPRDAYKGVIARALIYFILRYQNYSGFFTSQEATLRQWHKDFLPNAIEKKRNNDIFLIQKNRNPFIDYPQFVERINSLGSTSTVPVVKSIDIIEGSINFSEVEQGKHPVYRYCMVNNGNSDVHIQNISVSDTISLGLLWDNQDTVILPGESLTILVMLKNDTLGMVAGTLSFNTDLPYPANVMVPVLATVVPVGIKETSNFEGISLYPNPVAEYFEIYAQTEFISTKFVLNIYDISGRKQQVNYKFADKMFVKVNCSNLPEGMYIAEVFYDGKIKRWKFVKQ